MSSRPRLVSFEDVSRKISSEEERWHVSRGPLHAAQQDSPDPALRAPVPARADSACQLRARGKPSGGAGAPAALRSTPGGRAPDATAPIRAASEPVTSPSLPPAARRVHAGRSPERSARARDPASAKSKHKSVNPAIHSDTLGLAQELAAATATLQIELDSARAAIRDRDQRILELESGMRDLRLEAESNLLHERKMLEYETVLFKKEAEAARARLAGELRLADEDLAKLKTANAALLQDNRRLAVDHKALLIQHHELKAELECADNSGAPRNCAWGQREMALLERAINRMLAMLQEAGQDTGGSNRCATQVPQVGGKAEMSDMAAPGDISELIQEALDVNTNDSREPAASPLQAAAIAQAMGSLGNETALEESGSSSEWVEVDRNRASAAAVIIQQSVRGRQARQVARAIILENIRMLEEGGWDPSPRPLSTPSATDQGVSPVHGATVKEVKNLRDEIRMRVEVGTLEGETGGRLQVALKLVGGSESAPEIRGPREERHAVPESLDLSQKQTEPGSPALMREQIDSLEALLTIEAFLLKCLDSSALQNDPAPPKQVLGLAASDAGGVVSARLEKPCELQEGAPGVSQQVEWSAPCQRLSISRIMLEQELVRIGEMEVEMAGVGGGSGKGQDGGQCSEVVGVVDERGEQRLSISRIILEKELRKMGDAEAWEGWSHAARSATPGEAAARHGAGGGAGGEGAAKMSISRSMLETELAMIEEMESTGGGRCSDFSQAGRGEEGEKAAHNQKEGTWEGKEDGEKRQEKRLSISRIILENELGKIREAQAGVGWANPLASDPAAPAASQHRDRAAPAEGGVV